MKSKFEFFERVKIISRDKKIHHLYNTSGTVLGKAEPTTIEDTWGYSITCDLNGYTLSFEENELESLGTFANREDYYTGDTMKVGVTEKGKGYIKEYNKAYGKPQKLTRRNN